MIFEKTATSVSLQAARWLSRQRALTIVLLYALVALLIAFVSYKVTFSMLLLPLASLCFSLAQRTPSYAPSPPPLPLPALARTHALGASSLHDARQRARINFASLPMRRPEAQLMLSYLRPSDVYLEFGASGSTLSVPTLVRAAFSVEHDVHVCKGIHAEMQRHAHLARSLRAFCVPVRAGHAQWALRSAFEEGSYAAFQNYVDLPRSNLSHHTFDRVLINGRARVACALRILPQLKATSLVFLHDLFARAAHYAAVLPFYEEVARVVAHSRVDGYSDEPMGLLVLRPRAQYLNSDVSVARVNAIYAQYVEQPPSQSSAQLPRALQHALSPSHAPPFAYQRLSARLRRHSTYMRLLLDALAIPFVLLTYMVLRDVFRKLFAHALCAASPRAGRLLAAAHGAVLVTHTASSTSLPPPPSVTAKAE